MYPLQVYVVMAQPETGALQTFILQQTDGKHIKSRMIYPTTSPSHIKSVKCFLGMARVFHMFLLCFLIKSNQHMKS